MIPDGLSNALADRYRLEGSPSITGTKASYYLAPFVVWILLAVTGILPGTSRYRRSFIDHQVLLANRGEAPAPP